MNWKELFGEILLIKDSNKIITTSTEEYLNNKYILIYFSAHWCPPCRGFTPQLVTFYNNLKRNENKSFEIIFASSDKDQHSFDEYYSEMPWASIPFQEREIKNKLSTKFKISGIPSLIVLNTDGSLLTAKGRNCVGNDPSGADFPWIPQTLQQELGTNFIGKSGDVDASSFAGKFVGFYFSAHWCPPCRGFTPKLVKYYNHRKELGKDDFEIIFVSGDRDPNQFREYYNEMPWLALPFNDPRISKLNERFEVEGIPALVIVDPDGNVTTNNARIGVMTDPNGEKFPYYPEPVEDISQGVESFGLDINSVPALIALMENSDDDDQNDARTILASFGEIHAKSKVNTPEGPEMIFFYAFQKSPISDQIRRLAQLPTVEKSTTPKLLLLDIPDNGGFYVSDAEEVTEDTVRDFIQGYKNKSLRRNQLSRA